MLVGTWRNLGLLGDTLGYLNLFWCTLRYLGVLGVISEYFGGTFGQLKGTWGYWKVI